MIGDRFDLAATLPLKVPKIIEAFVSFYGEEYREKIEKKLGEATYIGYLNPGDYLALTNDLKEEIGITAGYSFLEKIGLDQTEENFKQFFTFEYGFGTNLDRLKSFYEGYNSDSSWLKQQALNALKKFFSDDELKFNSPKYFEYASKLNEYKSIYEEVVKFYNEELEKYKSYFEMCEKVNEIKDKLNKKYTIKYLEELSPYLSEKDKLKINDGLSIRMDCYETLVGYSYEAKCLLDAFSEESEEILNNPNSSEYAINSIKKDRINYYKKNGLDLGDEYEAYLNNSEALKLKPTNEFINYILELRKKLSNEEKNELYTILPNIENQRRLVESLGLENADNGFLNSVKNQFTCICPNFIKKGEQIIVHPLLFINGARDNDIIDCSIIHECNHIYELCITDLKEKEVTFCSGWDFMTDKIAKVEIDTEIDEDRQHRTYELLSEIINDLIASEITTIMHRQGVFLYSEKENAKNTSGSSYLSAAILVMDFYNEFKDSIIKSRNDNNIDIILNEVGKENFLQLNKLVHDFLEYFSGFKIYSTRDQLANGIESEDTVYYKKCVEESQDIFEKMKSHKVRLNK